MSKAQILIVEDDVIVAMGTENRLKNLGYAVSGIAPSGEEAIEQAKEKAPDLVLMDIMLRGAMDGTEAADHIRTQFNIPVVYATAHADEKVLERAKLTGPFGYVIKPFDDRELDTTIQMALYKHKSDEELRESEEKYRLLVETMNDGLGVQDENGLITYVNDSLCKMWGYSSEELIGRCVTDFLDKANRAVLKEQMERRQKGQQSSYEIVWTGKDERKVTTIMSPAPILDAIEHFKGSFAVITDISERKTADEEKRKLEAQLQQAERMEAIGTLAGGIAHDFNNLLMGIQGNVSLMRFETEPEHPHYDMLKTIEGQVKSGATLTKQLLGYARKGQYDVRAVNLNKLVKETSETFGRTRKDTEIHLELAEDLFAIEADQGQIEQIILSLYVNASDAMPGGGDLTLKTTNVTHQDMMKDKPYDAKPGNYVLLTVTDTGSGMDKETRERIFDPFFTTKNMASGRGTGLGLASAYGIVKAHAGYIDVESEKGKGTTFSIYLPATEKKAGRAVEVAEQITKASGTVLLVDDEEVILDVGIRFLEKLGYAVLDAESGRKALELYEHNRDKIDIVILDMVMPGLGGGEAYDKMKEINPNVKVLLSSGYSIEDAGAKAILDRGCDGFIQKPFSMEQLSQSIQGILGKQ